LKSANLERLCFTSKMSEPTGRISAKRRADHQLETELRSRDAAGSLVDGEALQPIQNFGQATC
jgi:hypothetical protein